MDLFGQFYAGSCTAALEHFCDKHWPCSFVSRKGRACVNVKSSHNAKGHQSANGKIISTGRYGSTFSAQSFSGKWKAMIKDQLQQMESQLVEKKLNTVRAQYGTDNAMAYHLHRRRIGAFYCSFQGFTASNFRSLTTCLSCIMEVPQHPLQCGHILCTACIKAYGRPNDRNSVIMDFCPLNTTPANKHRPWPVHFKPDYAGVRILTLDG